MKIGTHVDQTILFPKQSLAIAISAILKMAAAIFKMASFSTIKFPKYGHISLSWSFFWPDFHNFNVEGFVYYVSEAIMTIPSKKFNLDQNCPGA